MLAVAEAGSFTVAARRVGTSQSQVSRAVATVEDAIGRALFERSTRAVHLTEAGREFVERIGVVAAELDAAVRAVQPTSAPMPRLVLASLTSVSELHLPTALADGDGDGRLRRFRCIEGLQATVVHAVWSGTASVGIGDLADIPDGLVARPLWTEPFVVAVATDHRLARRDSLALDEITGEPLIAFSRDAELRTTIDRELAAARQLRAPEVVVDRFRTALGLVAAGRGVMVVPAIARAAIPPGATSIGLEHTGLRRTVGTLHRPDTPPAAAITELVDRLTTAVTTLDGVDRL